jgi:hypothetical protein
MTFRKVVDSEFFNEQYMKEILSKTNDFYTDFIQQKFIFLNVTERIDKVIEIIKKE